MTGEERNAHGELFLRYRDHGDLAAFETVMDAFHGPLFHYLYRMLKRRDEAEDALQEVWLKVIRQQEQYREQGQFSSWIYRIAHNHCLDQFRRSQTKVNQNEVVETGEGVAVLDTLSSEIPSPADTLEEKELEERLEMAVNQLPELLREVYVLRSVHDIPFKEIAEIQGSPLGTVLSRMHQATNRLRQWITLEEPTRSEESA